MSKGNAFLNETVNGGCFNVWITESSDGVEALLIGAVPKNVGARRHSIEIEKRTFEDFNGNCSGSVRF